MSYRAGKRDFVVATDTDNLFAVRFHTRGPQVTAAEVVVDDFVIYDSHVWPTFSTTPMGTDKVELVLGSGNFYEPHLTLNNSDLVTLAPPTIWEAIDMQVALPDTVYSPPPATLAVPTSIIDEGITCLIQIGPEWLEPFQAQIDYAEGGPSGMSLPYDLVGVFGGQRTRVLTGTITIVRSAASAPVAPPVPPVPPGLAR